MHTLKEASACVVIPETNAANFNLGGIHKGYAKLQTTHQSKQYNIHFSVIDTRRLDVKCF